MWKELVPWAVCFAVGLAVGGWAADRHAQGEINELKEEHLHLINEITTKTNEAYSELADKLQQREKELARAMDARDRALAVGDSLRADARRLRQQAADAGQRLSSLPRADGASCQRDRELLARCTKLLGEGADLAGEGAGLSLRIAGDKDALGVR